MEGAEKQSSTGQQFGRGNTQLARSTNLLQIRQQYTRALQDVQSTAAVLSAANQESKACARPARTHICFIPALYERCFKRTIQQKRCNHGGGVLALTQA